MNDIKAFKILSSIVIILIMFIICFNVWIGPSILPSYRDYKKIYISYNKEKQKTIGDLVSTNNDNAIDDNKNDTDFIVDINGATKEELMLIPYIGEVLAEKIIEYRNEFGDFESEEELLNIEGIGEKKYNKIKDYIVVDYEEVE